MKQLKILLVLGFVAIFCYSCESDEIIQYKAENSAINFPGGTDKIPNSSYNSETKMFSHNFSFLDSIGSESAVVKLSVKVVGPTAPYDRKVNFEIDSEFSSATTADYEFLEAVVPSDSLFGYIAFRVKYDASLQTEDKMLRIKLRSSDDFLQGYENYNVGEMIWNEKLVPPSTSATKKTYNHLIKGEAAPSNSNLNYYSPNAHKLILIILETDEIPGYNKPPFMIFSNYTAYCAKMNKYLADWDRDHPDDPWIHDAGKSKGEKIRPRGY